MNRIFIILLLLLLLCCCNQNKPDEFICPYETISNYSIESSKKDDLRKNITGFGVTLNSQLKKIGVGELNGEYINEIERKNNDLIKNGTFYDTLFVKKWNSMVVDICGKLEIHQNMELEKEELISLKKDILDRVKNFYESMMDMNISEDIINPNKNDEYIERRNPHFGENFMEIPFQLNKKTLGFRKVLYDGEDYPILSNSTKYNPRIKIDITNEGSHRVTVITMNNDTCDYFLMVDKETKNRILGRINLKCN